MTQIHLLYTCVVSGFGKELGLWNNQKPIKLRDVSQCSWKSSGISDGRVWMSNGWHPMHLTKCPVAFSNVCLFITSMLSILCTKIPCSLCQSTSCFTTARNRYLFRESRISHPTNKTRFPMGIYDANILGEIMAFLWEVPVMRLVRGLPLDFFQHVVGPIVIPNTRCFELCLCRWLGTIPIGIGISRWYISRLLDCKSRYRMHARWLCTHTGHAVENHGNIPLWSTTQSVQPIVHNPCFCYGGFPWSLTQKFWSVSVEWSTSATTVGPLLRKHANCWVQNPLPQKAAQKLIVRKFVDCWTLNGDWLNFDGRLMFSRISTCHAHELERFRVTPKQGTCIDGSSNFKISTVKDHEFSPSHKYAMAIQTAGDDNAADRISETPAEVWATDQYVL